MRMALSVQSRKTRGLLPLVCLVPRVLAGGLSAGGNMPAPEPEHVSSTWITTRGDYGTCFRLQLDDGGTGVFGISWFSKVPMIYRVTSWQLTDDIRVHGSRPEQSRELLLTVAPVGDAPPLELSCRAHRSYLKLQLVWEGRSPVERTLFDEARMTQRVQQVRQAMEAVTGK